MMDRADVEIAGLDVAEGTLGLAQALVSEDDARRWKARGWELGSDDVNAVERRLGGNRLGLARPAEARLGNSEREVLGHVAAIEHGAEREADLVLATQRLARALGHRLNLGQRLF